MEALVLVKGIALGCINGVALAVGGYLKNKPEGESFEVKKFFDYAVVGAVTGGVGAYMGISYDLAYGWLTMSGTITIVEYIKKIVWRNLKNWWDNRKLAPVNPPF